ncbi:MAG: hypothetical protein CMJ64_24490 [Planctomycetaceae bacterium]|nr:hypothetical protein [Planctomycetaceae bacterium]
MTNDFLADRRRALEESFFAKRNQALLEGLKVQLKKEQLAKASGICEDVVLDSLVDAGFSADTVAALSLAPLVAVAWADGKLADAERDALLEASSKEGISEGSTARELFENWLQEAPDENLVSAWKAFVGAAVDGFSEPAAAFRHDLIGRAKKVAQAAGGILGLGSISSSEQKVLDDLESAFPS